MKNTINSNSYRNEKKFYLIKISSSIAHSLDCSLCLSLTQEKKQKLVKGGQQAYFPSLLLDYKGIFP